MRFNPAYLTVAEHVLLELGRYTGEAYAVPFVTGADRDRLAAALQRAVEHMQAGGHCTHDEPCKPEWAVWPFHTRRS